ncbi:MAG TPA: GAF domain-containing sensor histidine kinase [Kofleriaceae bacterium]|nr:GAF domain-containing sensor histidine kinase [Kofleriaceae bacterium]
MGDDAHGDRLAFETARLALARMRVEPATQRAVAVEQALRLCAHTLDVERVGFWTFSPAGDELVCERSYTRSTDEMGGGDRLRCDTFPTYTRALQAQRVIAAADAVHHPTTSELADGYLRPLGITSMLDAPVFQAGVLVGVVCHEHLGQMRSWSSSEIHFAGSVADLLAMVLEQNDRLKAQEQLRQRLSRVVGGNQLGALEHLARSVAHDFANVVLAVELVATRLAARGRERSSDEDIELGQSLRACAEVGGSLVDQLRRFGARAETPRRLPLAEILERLAPILRTLIRDVAVLQVEIDLPAGAEAAVPVDRIEQLVLNLCLNARDAIASAARGDAAKLGETGTIVVRAAAGANEVVLEIWDDGTGMSPELLERLWEPYFTTKPDGNGIGLGTVKAIVDDAGGSIQVDSKPGVGSTFVVRLPRA